VGDIEAVQGALDSMGGVLLCGYSELDEDARLDVAEHVIDEEHWARLTKPKKAARTEGGAVAGAGPSSSLASQQVVPQQGQAIVSRPTHFVTPRPGPDGPRNGMDGLTFVLTGTFPEIGGGCGLGVGKDKVTAMIESFGGRVTSAISGKTDVLVVGKEPGFAKVTQAENKRAIRIMTLQEVRDGLCAGRIAIGEAACIATARVAIDAFSSGYHGNSTALTASASALDLARYGRQQGGLGRGRSPSPAMLQSLSPGSAPARASTPTTAPKQRIAAPPADATLPPGWKRMTHKGTGQVKFLAPDGTRHDSLPRPGLKRKAPTPEPAPAPKKRSGNPFALR